MQDSKQIKRTNKDAKKIKNETKVSHTNNESKNESIVSSLSSIKNMAIATKINDKQFILDFTKGNLKDDEAWFIKKDDQEFVVLPEEVLGKLLGAIKTNHEEKIFISLRHELKELMPIDIDDVMIVGVDEIEKYRSKDGNLPLINVKQIAKNIKKNYPNLFINLGSFFM